MNFDVVRVGETYSKGFGLGGDSLDDWQCSIQLRGRFDGQIAAGVDRAVTLKSEDNLEFIAQLGAAEVEQLEVGAYYELGAELVNQTTQEEKQGSALIQVRRGAVY